jgi:hypothetical protein
LSLIIAHYCLKIRNSGTVTNPFEKYRGAAGEGSMPERTRRLRGEYPRGDEEATDS